MYVTQTDGNSAGCLYVAATDATAWLCDSCCRHPLELLAARVNSVWILAARRPNCEAFVHA
eukprot:gene12044-6017_t